MELKKRVITGACLTAAGALITVFSYIPAVIKSACLVLCLAGQYELLKASGKYEPWQFTLAAIFSAVFMLMPMKNYFLLCAATYVIFLLVFAWIMKKITVYYVTSVIQVLPFLIMLPIFFRSLYEQRAFDFGVVYLILAVTECALCDIAAYFTGKAIGKHHLAPHVSPHKTVEGSIGGAAFAVAVLLCASFFARPAVHTNYAVFIPYIILAAFAGQFGDLSFSSIKRGAGIKDYGKIFPGHGGVLDRFDSLLFTAPLLYCIAENFPMFS